MSYLTTTVYEDLEDEYDKEEYSSNAHYFWDYLSEYVMVHGTEEDKVIAAEFAAKTGMVWDGERWINPVALAEFDAWNDAYFNDDNSDDLFAELVAQANGEPELETDIEDADSDDE